MAPVTSPLRMGYEPQLQEEPACRTTQKQSRSPNVALLLLLLLLSLTAVMFCATLAIGYITHGPRIMHDDTIVAFGTITPTTPTPVKTTPATRKPTPVVVVVPVDLSVSYVRRLGTEQHTGDLPAHVEPQHYDVTVILDGANLATREMKVTGRAEASLEVLKATSKLILNAKASTIKEIKVAVLEVPAATGEEPRGLNITTLSTSDPFLIVALEEPLEVGKSYTLVTEYDYKSVQGGPISLTAELTKMQLQKGEAHAAFPCFERTGWNVPVALTLQIPRGHSAVANAPMDGQPEVTGSVSANKFKDALAMPPDMLAWTVFPTTPKFAEVVPGMSIYAKMDNADLKASAKDTLEFLLKYIQALVKEAVTKIETMFADLVFPQASETQEGLGFVGLEARNTPATVCSKTTNQWIHVIMRQLKSPAWLGLAGVSYLCRLAINEQNKQFAAFMKDFKECKKDTPAPGTWVNLLFALQGC